MRTRATAEIGVPLPLPQIAATGGTVTAGDLVVELEPGWAAVRWAGDALLWRATGTWRRAGAGGRVTVDLLRAGSEMTMLTVELTPSDGWRRHRVTGADAHRIARTLRAAAEAGAGTVVPLVPVVIAAEPAGSAAALRPSLPAHT